MDVQQPSSATPQQAVELERQTIQHEHLRIDRRMGWMVTLHGFLFAALALIAGASPSDFTGAARMLIPIVGLGSALLTAGGVHGAYLQVDFVERKADGVAPDRLPFGRIRWPRRLGRLHSYGLPLLLAGAWAALLIAQR